MTIAAAVAVSSVGDPSRTSELASLMIDVTPNMTAPITINISLVFMSLE